MHYVSSALRKNSFNPGKAEKIEPRYDVARIFSDFETLEECRKEDELRINGLGRLGSKLAGTLVHELVEAERNGHILKSLASKAYNRVFRRRMASILLRKALNEWKKVCLFTLIIPAWRVTAKNLTQQDAEHFKLQLRALLRKHGLLRKDGILFAVLHCEYDGQNLHFHFHGIAVGEVAECLEVLRKDPLLKSTDLVRKTLDTEVICPKTKFEDLARYILYCFQLTWYARQYFMKPSGKWARRRKRQRIPEPVHSQVMLWLAQQKPFDLILMTGLRLGKRGGRITLVPSRVSEK